MSSVSSAGPSGASSSGFSSSGLSSAATDHAPEEARIHVEPNPDYYEKSCNPELHTPQGAPSPQKTPSPDHAPDNRPQPGPKAAPDANKPDGTPPPKQEQQPKIPSGCYVAGNEGSANWSAQLMASIPSRL